MPDARPTVTGVVRALAGGLRTVLVGSDRVPGQRRRRTWPLVVAAVITLLVALTMRDARLNYHPPAALALPLALFLALPALLLVRWPLMAWRLSLVTILALVPFWRGDETLPCHPLQLILYLATVVAIGLRHRRIVLGWVLAITMLAVWLVIYPRSTDNATGATVVVTLLVLASGGIGALLTARRQLAVETQRTEAERAHSALLEERARIARELHDVVAHHMSLIAVQAETASYRLPGLPADAGAEFTSISGAAREALVEMRRLLGVLRSDPADTPAVSDGDTPAGRPEHDPVRAPQPGLAALPALMDRVRAAGTEVSLVTEGTARPVPPGVDVSAYRVVQESLSNARRHAPGAAVRVLLGYDPGAVRVEITNDPSPAPPVPGDGSGHGLLGMRERAAMLGGSLSAAATDDGGFRVAAVLPCGTDEGGS